MKGLMKTQVGAGNVEIREMPDPKPGPGEVLIEVKAAGTFISGRTNTNPSPPWSWAMRAAG
jgi:NADPH:quinone reductase-like Zn-dependent oxidoreductase